MVYVDEFIIDDGDDTNDDPLQLFRGTLTVDANTPGATTQWQTIEAAQFNLTLVEQGSNELLSGFTVTATSEDGLGEFILGPSDENGVIDASLMQGSLGPQFEPNRYQCPLDFGQHLHQHCIGFRKCRTQFDSKQMG